MTQSEMMSRSELVRTVREIVVKHSRVLPAHVNERVTLGGDLGFDSLAFLLTISDLETRLGFHFPLERVDELVDISLGELVHLVANGGARAHRRTGGNGAGPS